ncbi:MAG TPA: oligosaccharide flippase family protein, partial [Candidatus Latescibacteria bacterium]|nr:oligosaccharide flippase family protein [Candidatus Latescibacterota bacterium]
MSPAARTHRSDAALLARGAIVNLLGNIGRLSRAFSLMLIAWLFGAEALGLYVLAWATTEFLRRFVSYGIEPTIVYKLGPLLVSHDDTRIAQTIASSLVLVGVTSLVGSLALYFGAPFIANTVLREPRLVEVLPVFVFAMPAFAVTSVFLAATRAKKIMRFEIIARSFVEPFVLLLGTLVAWAAKTGVTGLVVAQTSAFWISAFFCAYFYATQFPLRALLAALRRPSRLAGVFHFATPVAAKDVIAQGVARIDLFLVGHLLDVVDLAVRS